MIEGHTGSHQHEPRHSAKRRTTVISVSPGVTCPADSGRDHRSGTSGGNENRKVVYTRYLTRW